MNGETIIILLGIAAAVLVVLVAKLASFWHSFAEDTEYICYEMEHAHSYKEYRKWRGELRCHYLCLIPFVNENNVMRLYRKIYRRGDSSDRKERKDALFPLLFPSILGMGICIVCICGMTWAWFSDGIESPTHEIIAAYYDITVEYVKANGTEIKSADGGYTLDAGTEYTVTLKAGGSIENCGGCCLIENNGTGSKLYTQSLKPGEELVFVFTPADNGIYTFIGLWGSHPAGTTEETIIKGTLITSDGTVHGNQTASPTVNPTSLSDSTQPVTETPTASAPADTVLPNTPVTESVTVTVTEQATEAATKPVTEPATEPASQNGYTEKQASDNESVAPAMQDMASRPE